MSITLPRALSIYVATAVLTFVSATIAVADVRPASPAKDDLFAVAASADRFTTLTAALEASGLDDVFSVDGPFTIFAPTDAAFAALPDGIVELLFLPENRDMLVDVLTYHVVPGKVLAAEVATLHRAKTIGGKQLNISVVEETVRIDNAKVLVTDVAASNGVIHAIDTVMLPM